MLQRWGKHPALIGFEPVNEPWWFTDLRVLKILYRDVRKLVKEHAPGKYFVFHNSFRREYKYWDDLFDQDDRELVAVDDHLYVAWQFNETVKDVCDQVLVNAFSYAKDFKDAGYEVWIGEWSLATDTCAHWLSGFNDGKDDDHKKATCAKVECPYSYLPADEFDTSFDRHSTEPLGPASNYDLNLVGITNGMCWKDSDYYNYDQID